MTFRHTATRDRSHNVRAMTAPPMALPHRFDVHALVDLTADIGNRPGAGELMLDASAVAHADAAALEWLDRLVAERSVVVVDPSLALQVVCELTGQDHLVGIEPKAAA